MKRMFKLTKPRKLGLSAGARLLILSTAINVLSGCACLKPFPTKTLWEFDTVNQICAEYVIVDEKNLKYDFVREVPLQKCPPIFGFDARSVPKVINWAVDAQKCADKNCFTGSESRSHIPSELEP